MSKTSPPSEDETLLKFRQEIDGIDDKLLKLLEERIKIVEKVGAHKLANGEKGAAIRPGREALMLRRIYEKFQNSAFHPEAAVSMWRNIISASTQSENHFTVSVYYTEAVPHYYWLAREYFGPFTPIRCQNNYKRVIGDILDKEAQIGILPEPESDPQADDWWTHLLNDAPQWPKLFARVPFVEQTDLPITTRNALAIGHVVPEATGEDKALIVIEAAQSISMNKLKSFFDSSEIDAQWIVTRDQGPDTRLHLVELGEFISSEHPKLKKLAFEHTDTIYKVHVIGSYARPIVPSDKGR